MVLWLLMEYTNWRETMNKTFIVGRLYKDPEKVEGQDMAKMVVSVKENYTKADGTRPYTFFNVIVWNKMAENCIKYLKKGSMVGICGRTQNRSYDAPDGTKRYISEIVAEDIEFLTTDNKDVQ